METLPVDGDAVMDIPVILRGAGWRLALPDGADEVELPLEVTVK